MQPAAAPPPPAPPASPAPPRRGGLSPKMVLAVIVLLILAFFGGYIPQRLEANRLEESLGVTTLDLELATLHRRLGLAALEAQRSNFASAASAMNVFFDGCRRIAQDPRLANEPRTRTALGAYPNERDSIAVQLASADPLVAQRLASLYFTMEGVLARRE